MAGSAYFDWFPKTGLPFPDWVDNVVLAANTQQSYTVPAGYKWAVLASDQTFYFAAKGATASVPSTNNTSGTGAVPGTGVLIEVDNVKAISLIAAQTTVVAICLFH
jgi:hypothetical protein